MPEKRRPSSLPLILVAIGLLLIFGAGGYYLYSFLNPPQTVYTYPQGEASYPDVPRVSLADAKAAYETRGAVFVDVRDAASYARSHIPGALSIPVGDLETRRGEFNPSDWIIPYCT